MDRKYQETVRNKQLMYMILQVWINKDKFTYIYIYMVAPPPGPTWEGMYHLPSVALNAFKDMLRKHCKIQCFMHILLVVF